MPYATNSLYQTAAGIGSVKRVFPASLQPKTFAPNNGTFAVGQVVSYNTSTNKWVPWANGGANGTGQIQGIVFPDPVVTHATDDVLGQVMLTGRAHVDDLIPGGAQTVANMKSNLRGSVRTLGIIIEGLDNFR